MSSRDARFFPFGLLLLLAVPAFSQPAPAGPEITLATDPQPAEASLVVHPNGSFTALWQAGSTLPSPPLQRAEPAVGAGDDSG